MAAIGLGAELLGTRGELIISSLLGLAALGVIVALAAPGIRSGPTP